MWKRYLGAGLIAGLTIFIAGCATTGRLPVSDLSWDQRAAGLAALDHWQAQGRLAIRADDESWNASLNWRQTGEHYEIQVSAPLGQGAARLVSDGVRVTMELPDEPAVIADDVELLLQQRLGWYVPVNGLRYWLTGRPDPRYVSQFELDGASRLSRLQQGGWSIVYQRYAAVDGLELPVKIELLNPRLRVRMVIDDWRMGS